MKQKLKNSWQHLLSMYFSNKISRAELEELLSKLDAGKDLEEISHELKKQWELAAPDQQTAEPEQWNQLFSRLMEQARQEEAKASKRKSGFFHRLIKVSVAAMVLLVAGSIYYLSTVKQDGIVKGKTKTESAVSQDLAPGRNGAILTLADGRKINLDSTSNIILAVQGDATVSLQDGQIAYDKKGNSGNEVLYNIIETPRGRQFQILLADGSKVWLNAASSMRYPATFNGNERHVEVSGEAYFEVATQYSKDRSRKIPFTVGIKNGDQPAGNIEVLGTQFNVNTYDHINQVEATLLEGSVKVNSLGASETIDPGQQARFATDQSGPGNIRVINKVDLEQVMAWKNGYFSFANSDLESVMRQISRWYDVEIEYEGKLPRRKFGGEISRNLNASQVLKVLEETDVHFRIDGKKIVVMP